MRSISARKYVDFNKIIQTRELLNVYLQNSGVAQVAAGVVRRVLVRVVVVAVAPVVNEQDQGTKGEAAVEKIVLKN